MPAKACTPDKNADFRCNEIDDRLEWTILSWRRLSTRLYAAYFLFRCYIALFACVDYAMVSR